MQPTVTVIHEVRHFPSAALQAGRPKRLLESSSAVHSLHASSQPFSSALQLLSPAVLASDHSRQSNTQTDMPVDSLFDSSERKLKSGSIPQIIAIIEVVKVQKVITDYIIPSPNW